MKSATTMYWSGNETPALVGPSGQPVNADTSPAEVVPLERSESQPVVLLATQQLQVRAIGTTILQKAGFRVTAESRGEAILGCIDTRPPDLILTDLALDDMGAARLCAGLRKLPAGRAIPMLVISDLSDSHHIQKILSEEFTDIIAAPVNWRVATFRIHRWLSMAKKFRSLSDQELDLEQVKESALKASTELLQLRNYDAVTGLPNREMFVSSLGLVLAQGQRSSVYSAVLYLDIDDFREVNDLIGRSLADELLRIVAKRLQGCLRDGDLVSQIGDEGSLASFARVNGDQFAILLGSVQDQKAALIVAERLLASLARPLTIRDREFRLGAKIGIADSLNLEGEGEEVLLQRAETAMRYCKQHERKACAVFESFMNQVVLEKLELKAEIRKALDEQQLFLCYQLLVDSRTSTPMGVEGLVRWQHPERGLVSPNDFLPVAEESDLIAEIDRWVLLNGCQQGRKWLDDGYPPLLMSLNVSMRFLAEEDFAQQVLAIIEETGFPPSWLQLELSERGNLPDAGRIMSQFETLVQKGVHLALDDFGTGQTSLSYLRTLPISCVKVDRSFVSRVPNDTASAAIVTAIVAMSHHLGLKVVAEGVETVDHQRFLAENNYDQLQGYLFSRPERVEEVETGFRNLKNWNRIVAEAAGPKGARERQATQMVPRPLRAAQRLASRSAEDAGPAQVEAERDDPTTRSDLLQLARNDFLTKLYNRYSFDERLEHAVAHADRFGHKVALLLIDLDDFKYVNDTFGHGVGDALLIKVAKRLRKLVRKIDTLARIGGDEFAVILSEFNDVKNVMELAGRLLSVLAQSVDVDGRELRVTGSLGISVYPAGSTRAKDLLRQADLALYKAKNNGGNSARFFAREMDWEVQRRLALARDLEGAADRGELFLEYQQQVALDTRQVVGVEALLRWAHPTKGVIGPGRLIPIAESTGEIRAIGDWVIRSACAQAKQWQQTFDRDVPVSVNLSPVQCRDSKFAATVQQALEEKQLAPRLLDLELNEKLLENLPQDLEQSFRQLGELGVRLTLDNFGSGASALEHFQRFRFDRLKIHQSLVRTITQRSTGASVLSGIVALARKMKVQIVAEGIEAPEEVESLLAEGCEVGQGFLFSKPLSAGAISELLGPEDPRCGGAERAFTPPEAPPKSPAASVLEIVRVPVDEPPAMQEAPKAYNRTPTEKLLIALPRPSVEDPRPPEVRSGAYALAASARRSAAWGSRRRMTVSLAVMAIPCLLLLPGAVTESVVIEPGDRSSTIAPAPIVAVDLPASAAEVSVPATEPASSIDGPAARPAPVPETLNPEARQLSLQEQQVVDLAHSWARAWSEQRVDDYLGYYDAEFRPTFDLSRADWENQRTERILKPRRIELELRAFEVQELGDGRVSLSFDQLYRSDDYHDRVRKTLELVQAAGRWKILVERAAS
ncbi:MAG: EAL domain-containing protein [bacterium]|nr:EAL domain-containing protein [bacterium]